MCVQRVDNKLNSWWRQEEAFDYGTHLQHGTQWLSQTPAPLEATHHPETTRRDLHDLNTILAGSHSSGQVWIRLPSGSLQSEMNKCFWFFKEQIQELFRRQASLETSVLVPNFKTMMWHFNIWQREMNLRSLKLLKRSALNRSFHYSSSNKS